MSDGTMGPSSKQTTKILFPGSIFVVFFCSAKKTMSPHEMRKEALRNRKFRHILHTSNDKSLQQVAMRLAPGARIGLERHAQVQIFWVVHGHGRAIVCECPVGGTAALPPCSFEFGEGDVWAVPAGALHDVIACRHSHDGVALITYYAPAAHSKDSDAPESD